MLKRAKIDKKQEETVPMPAGTEFDFPYLLHVFACQVNFPIQPFRFFASNAP
jgi:hypothetical protein